MICPNCGAKISASANICPGCGVRIVHRPERPQRPAPHKAYEPQPPEYDEQAYNEETGYEDAYDPNAAYDDEGYDDPNAQPAPEDGYDYDEEYDPDYDEYEDEEAPAPQSGKPPIPKKVWILIGLLVFAIVMGILLGLLLSRDGGKMPTVSTVDPLTTTTQTNQDGTTTLAGLVGTTTSAVSTTSGSTSTSQTTATTVVTTQYVPQTQPPVVTTAPAPQTTPAPVVTTSPITHLDNSAVVGTWKGESGMYDITITLNSNATGTYFASSNGIPFPSVNVTYTYQSGTKQLCLTNPEDGATGGASNVMNCYVVVEGNQMYCYQSASAAAQHPSGATGVLTKQ